MCSEVQFSAADLPAGVSVCKVAPMSSLVSVQQIMFILVRKGSDDGVQHSGLLCFWTLPIFRHSKEQYVSKTESFSVFRWRVGDTYLLGTLERANFNHWMIGWSGLGLSKGSNRTVVSNRSPEDGISSSFRKLVLFSVFQRYKNQEIPKTNFDVEKYYELFSVISFFTSDQYSSN
jgi:hypothetical protein